MDQSPRWMWHSCGISGMFTFLTGCAAQRGVLAILGFVLVAVAALALIFKDEE